MKLVIINKIQTLSVMMLSSLHKKQLTNKQNRSH